MNWRRSGNGVLPVFFGFAELVFVEFCFVEFGLVEFEAIAGYVTIKTATQQTDGVVTRAAPGV